jgi:hypothetical protein
VSRAGACVLALAAVAACSRTKAPVKQATDPPALADPARAQPPATPEPIGEVVFASGFKDGWQDWGWSPRSVAPGAPAQVHFANWGGWILAKPGLAWQDAGGVVFRVKPPPGEGDFLEVRVESPKATTFPRIKVGAGNRTPLEDGWFEVRVPIDQLDPDGAPFDRIILRAFREVKDAVTLVDGVALTKSSQDGGAKLDPARFASTTQSTGMTVSCDARATRISPLVYGIAYYPSTDESAAQWALGATARRWGGNATSRYNWELSAWNLDADWFFENKEAKPWADLLADDAKHGVTTALTVPMMGWVAKDTTSYSFPVATFGAQGRTEPSNADIGDGTTPAGAKITPGSPSRTSVAASPDFVRRWVAAIVTADARTGKRSVQQYILDNEPMLWTQTHRDVRTEPLGYDELVERTIQYGTAVREADPGAVIAGPAEWGWTGYMYSGKDGVAGYAARPDRRAHDDVPVVEWYLRKLREHEQRTGVRVLDVLDLHFYPQGDGVYGDRPTDAKIADLRLRQTRGLWDPTYVDESWIKEPVRLLPRMKEWVEKNYPGRGISIGEWNFGGEDHVTGALAIAEALGRFAQFGVTSAFYWTHPPDGSPAVQGFVAYHGFDGHGGRFLDWYVPTSAPPGLSLFASRDEAGQHMVLVAINMSSQQTSAAAIDLGTCGGVASYSAYTYARGKLGFVPWAAPPSPRGNGIDQVLPPWSITVLDVHLARPMGGPVQR